MSTLKSYIRGKQVFTIIASVLLSVFLVVLFVYGATTISTNISTDGTLAVTGLNASFGTSTPGAALSVKGAGLFDGFVSANYFTATSTTDSWFLGGLGLGTTTVSDTLNADGSLAIEGSALIGGVLTVSTIKSTSTTDVIFAGALDVRESATSTFIGGINITTTGGLSSAVGLTITGGDIESSGKLTVTSVANSSFIGNLGIATTTPGAELGISGASLFEGFVGAAYFTSTSTADSWLLGGFGLGTTTVSDTLNQDGSLAIEGSAIIGDTLYVSTIKSTSTTGKG